MPQTIMPMKANPSSTRAFRIQLKSARVKKTIIVSPVKTNPEITPAEPMVPGLPNFSAIKSSGTRSKAWARI